MEILTGLFIFGLYKATEKIWDKGFEAAWSPVGDALKSRFTHLAGKDKENQRRTAFSQAAKTARELTMRQAADPPQTEKILDALDGKLDKRVAEALAEEATKLMLFSAVPDVPRLTDLCHRTLRSEAIFTKESPPPLEAVAAVLSDFLTNLREALLDHEPYHDLIEQEMLRTLREVVAELRPTDYDTEDTYRVQLAIMYRELEFVGIPELKERRPITVEDIFVRLRTERERDPEAERELFEAYRQAAETRDAVTLTRLQRERNRLVHASVSREQLSIEQALHEANRLVVLGEPGAGKTMLLRYLTIICADGRAEIELGIRSEDGTCPLPIFIPLREFAAEAANRGEDYSLLDYLYTHAREHLILNLRRGFFEEHLESGCCLVCLDGLDEIWAVGQRKMVCDAVKALAARFDRSRYIVTSRIVGYEEAPLDRRNFVHHTVLPLTDDDIREFVHKWYTLREHDPARRKHKTDDLIGTIERQPRIQDLARNPLLLTIIALVHRIEAELPHERVKLYDKCVTALVDTWEEIKGLTIAEKQRPFYRHRRRLLERLAFELHTRAEKPGLVQTAKEGDLEVLLTRFLMEYRTLGLADDPDGARAEAQAFIRLARGRTGLLVERGEGVFGFPHLTFQEYLAACDVENRCIYRGADAIWVEIKDHLYDSHWREVILLLLGSLNKYDELPTLLVERTLEKDDEFEFVLHRQLYLTARALADRVEVADDLHRRIIAEVLTIARQGHWEPMEWKIVSENVVLVTRIRGEAAEAIDVLCDLKGDARAVEEMLLLALDRQAEPWIRLGVMRGLGESKRNEQKIADELLRVVQDSEEVDELRRAAASALGNLGCRDKKIIDNLQSLAHDLQVEAWMRCDAAEALGQLGHGEEAGDILLSLARDLQVEDGMRRAAAEALGRLGHTTEQVDILLSLARDPLTEARVRRTIATALGRLGRTTEQVDILLSLTHDPQVDAGVRRGAARMLERLGRTKGQVDILLSLVRDPQVEAGVRRAAATALGQLGPAKGQADILLSIARDPQVEAETRRAAAVALGQLGHAKEAGDILLSIARDPQVAAETRRAAAVASGQLGRAKEAGDILLSMARDPQVEAGVRRATAEALGQLGRAKEAGDILLSLVRDPQVRARVRRAAATALGQLGHAKEAGNILLSIARDLQVEAEVRRAAATASGRLGHAKEAGDVLLSLVRDPQVKAKVRRAAAVALGQLGRAKEAGDTLLSLARDPQVNAGVRRDTAEALRQLGRAKEAGDILLSLARDPQVEAGMRRNIAEALGRLGRTKEAGDILLSMVRDPQVDSEEYAFIYKSLKRFVAAATD